jgi:hypothetical protein
MHFDIDGNQIELLFLIDAAAEKKPETLPNTNATANLSTPHWQLLLTPCTGRTKAITPNLTSTTQRVLPSKLSILNLNYDSN